MKCKTCENETVHLLDGKYICQVCNFENEDVELQIDEYEARINRRNLIHSVDKRKKKIVHLKPMVCDWTTFEAFNFILEKQVSVLLELGASKNLKNAVLFLWSKYLQKCEVAFKEDESQPKLSHTASLRDVQALYGKKILYNWCKKPSTTSMKKKIQQEVEVKKGVKSDCKTDYKNTYHSESENEVDTPMEVYDIKITDPMLSAAALKDKRKRKYTKRLTTISSPTYISANQKNNIMSCMTMNKTISFLHLGLLVCKDLMSLSDLLRLIQEGRVPYIYIASIFPSHMKIHRTDIITFDTIITPSLNEVAFTSSKLVDFLEIPDMVQKRPIMPIVAHFVKDLNLPVSILPIVKLLVDKWQTRISKKNLRTRNIIQAEETKASAFILVALKTLFILDGKYENEHSDAMTKLNIILKDKKMFVWNRWQRQARLKDYLFMKDGLQFSSMTTLDKLNVDQILAKYPLAKVKVPDAPKPGENNNHNKPYKDHYMAYSSRHNIAKMVSNAVTSDNISQFKTPPTSFPLSQSTEVFPCDWSKYPFYSETDQMDTTILEEDFSRDILFLSDEDQEANDLAKLLISPFYKDTEYIYLQQQVSSIHQVLKTSSDYWLKYIDTKINQEPHKLEANWMDLLPSSFQFLLKFMCKYVSVSSPDLYHMMYTIEREVHLESGRKHWKKTPGPLHVDRKICVPCNGRKPKVYK